jgi:HEAT repeat protein
VVSSLDEAAAALKAIDPVRRREAAQYLAELEDPAAFEALLAALGDPELQAHEVILSGIVRQSVPDKVARLVTIVREDQPARRNAAISALLEIGAGNITALTDALHHASPDVRLHIAEILSDLRDVRAVPALLERLDDADEFPNVRHAAAQSLGKIGDRAATPALIRAAEAGEFWVRYAAVDALGRLGDERAVGPLLNLMKQDAWTRPIIVQALGNLEQPEAVEVLVAALEDSNDSVRVASMEALIKIVIEPGTTHRLDVRRLDEIRRVIPVPPLVRELNARASPRSAYAAHLLGWLTPLEALPDLIAALGQHDETLRYTAVEAVLRYGHVAIPELVEALTSPQPLIREYAAELLGMLADVSAVPSLLEHLQDEVLEVRQATIRALGSLGGDAAFEGLLQALEDPATRDTALGVLVQLRDAPLTNDLRRYLQNYLYQGKPKTRWAAAHALSLFGDEVAVSILLNAMRLLDDSIRLPAADALARVGGSRAVHVLIEALGDRDWLIRQKSVEALSNIPDGRAVAALLSVVHDPEWRVRKAIVLGLGRMDDARIFEPLKMLAQDADRWIRRAVMDLCAQLEDYRVMEILHAGVQDEDVGVRRAALVSLGRRRDPTALPAVIPLLTDSKAGIRVVAVRVAAQCGGVQAVEHVAMLVHDSVAAIRAEVADALGDIGSEDGVGALEVLLQDASPEVRRHAAQAMAHIGTMHAAEALAAALIHPLSKPEAQVELRRMGELAMRALLGTARSSEPILRAAAAESLGQLGDGHAVPTLKYLLRDGDLRVRQAAEAALKTLGAA